MTVPSSPRPLVLAVTARALFDLRDQATKLDEQAAYGPFRRAHEAVPLRPGSTFGLVRKLLVLNTGGRPKVEVILLSTDSADASLRVLRSIGHYGLPITRAAFTRGAPCHRYAAAFGAGLFLSTDANEVRLALDRGMAAATVIEGAARESCEDILQIAFDGDAVLFSDEAEQVYAHWGPSARTSSSMTSNTTATARPPTCLAPTCRTGSRTGHASDTLAGGLTLRATPSIDTMNKETE